MPRPNKSFDFSLPEERIALFPAEQRDQSQLLICSREKQSFEHARFSDLDQFLRAGDLLVFNNTKVLPARLAVTIDGKPNPAEVLLLRELEEGLWECLTKPAKRFQEGTALQFEYNSFKGTVRAKGEEGIRQIQFEPLKELPFIDFIEQSGKMPLPPYIKREANETDRSRYQTVYAAREGAVAAPTAGLHFTPQLLSLLKEKGIGIAEITLHVGLGTFRPLKDKNWEEGRLHPEQYEISRAAAEEVNAAVSEKRRVIAVGTTTVRTLEAAAKENFPLKPVKSETSLFIHPPYKFKVVQGMITNFHLPDSSLIWLVSAFAGEEFIRNAYNTALQKDYRFYSYGDAMLIE